MHLLWKNIRHQTCFTGSPAASMGWHELLNIWCQVRSCSHIVTCWGLVILRVFFIISLFDSFFSHWAIWLSSCKSVSNPNILSLSRQSTLWVVSSWSLRLVVDTNVFPHWWQVKSLFALGLCPSSFRPSSWSVLWCISILFLEVNFFWHLSHSDISGMCMDCTCFFRPSWDLHRYSHWSHKFSSPSIILRFTQGPLYSDF